jgi:pSer/pThr/pTyr-binding forkhead associated (FHA) protein
MSAASDRPLDPFAREFLTAREVQARLAAQNAGTAHVAFRDGQQALRITELEGDRTALVLGRRADADIALTWDPEVSGTHAEFRRIGSDWVLVDDGLSRNGTFVNGSRLQGRQRLVDGDRIRAGRTILAFQAGATKCFDMTRASSDAMTPQLRLSPTQRETLIALCRPLLEDVDATTAATNRQIAAELFITEQSVKSRLRQLFDVFGLEGLGQNEKRARLATQALATGLVTRRDLSS